MHETLWQRAASMAARAHLHQVRKDGRTPYFAHPARVALIVSHIFGCADEVALAAACLHDTIEDTTTDYDDLHRVFGREVADCVAALTKNMAMPEPAREADYERRLRGADWRARLVKLADQYDNYCDATGSNPASLEKTGRKCRQAIEIAAADVPDHPETRRAVERLTELLQRG